MAKRQLQSDLPWVDYTLHSADDCALTIQYQRQNGRLVSVSGKWDPLYPDEHTDSVTVEFFGADGSIIGSCDLSGDQHRDLECYDQINGFIDAVLNGEAIADAAERFCIAMASPV